MEDERYDLETFLLYYLPKQNRKKGEVDGERQKRRISGVDDILILHFSLLSVSHHTSNRKTYLHCILNRDASERNKSLLTFETLTEELEEVKGFSGCQKHPFANK